MLAVTVADVHFAGDVITGTGNFRVDVLADFDDFAAEFVTDDDGLVIGEVAAVVSHHFIAETGTAGYVINGLIGAADRGGHDSYFDFSVSNSRLWRFVGEFESVTGEARLLEC